MHGCSPRAVQSTKAGVCASKRAVETLWTVARGNPVTICSSIVPDATITSMAMVGILILEIFVLTQRDLVLHLSQQ